MVAENQFSLFLLWKKTQFLSHFNSKKPYQYLWNTHKPIHQLKILENGSKNPKWKHVRFIILGLNLFFFKKHWDSKQPPSSPYCLMKPVNTKKKIYSSGRGWLEWWFSLLSLESSDPSLSSLFNQGYLLGCVC
jgi:hypothetical protein